VVLERYRYDSYGTPTITKADGTILPAGKTRFLFTGREWDHEVGLYYYKARYYSPKTGRFLGRDPLGQIPGPNLYTYVGNDPVMFVDPFGLTPENTMQLPWWEALAAGRYYGTGLGQYATEFYANQQLVTGNWLWAIPGTFAALWTPSTYQATGWTLIGAGIANQVIGGGTYNQYYPTDDPGYSSRWLTRGNYVPGEEAQSALKLPEYNPGTAVREVRPNPFEPIAGPRQVSGGMGWEYYQGWGFPD